MKAEARLRWSVAFLAAAVLVYEIGMTRLLSFLLHYHFTFLVVSGAVCGLGLGAALAFYARPRPEQLGRWVGWVALVCALSMALAVCGFAFFPRLPPYLLALIAGFPIVLAGLFLTWVFTVCHGESAQLYPKAPPALSPGQRYHLYVLYDIALPIARCVFTAP